MAGVLNAVFEKGAAFISTVSSLANSDALIRFTPFARQARRRVITGVLGWMERLKHTFGERSFGDFEALVWIKANDHTLLLIRSN